MPPLSVEVRVYIPIYHPRGLVDKRKIGGGKIESEITGQIPVQSVRPIPLERLGKRWANLQHRAVDIAHTLLYVAPVHLRAERELPWERREVEIANQGQVITP